MFKIVLKNVTENTISKANVYYTDEKVNSYTQLKKLPISEGLNNVIKNSNKIIEVVGEEDESVKEIVVARDETIRVLNEIEELNTPDMIDCKKEEQSEIELITYFDKGEDISKYLNDYSPVNLYIAVDMETIHGYSYTQILFIALRYANCYSTNEKESLKLVFSVQDFDSRVIPYALENVNWEKEIYNSKMKTTSKKMIRAKKEE